MENRISAEVEGILKKHSQINSQLEEFIKASEEYNKLVQKGLANKRGYNIMTTQEIYDQAIDCAYSQPTQYTHNKF